MTTETKLAVNLAYARVATASDLFDAAPSVETLLDMHRARVELDMALGAHMLAAYERLSPDILARANERLARAKAGR